MTVLWVIRVYGERVPCVAELLMLHACLILVYILFRTTNINILIFDFVVVWFVHTRQLLRFVDSKYFVCSAFSIFVPMYRNFAYPH